MTSSSSTRPRGSYHHGDLANALTEAALDMARRGGPDAVVLRAAAREVGVSATAAYRHFADAGELLQAVKHRAQAALAERMRAETDLSSPVADPPAEALRRLGGLGLGYMRFAFEQPGLFRTAFCRSDSSLDFSHDMAMMSSPAFLMLTEILDSLVECGVMPPSRRPSFEIATWSTVHGLATLMLDGPLASCDDDERELLINVTLNMLVTAITAPVE